MAYREINRSQPNDGLGDDARTWSGKTNENFKEIFSRSFLLDGFEVSRNTYDPNDLGFDEFRNDDVFKGWYDNTKKRWVEGVVLDATNLNMPTDIDDRAKVFIINDKIKI